MKPQSKKYDFKNQNHKILRFMNLKTTQPDKKEPHSLWGATNYEIKDYCVFLFFSFLLNHKNTL